MVLGVSVSMLCISFGTFTVHTKFGCTQHFSQDKQWTISSFVSRTFCFKTQTMDNILNLLQIQRIAETFLDFASSMITTIPNFACPRTTINTHIFLVVYIIYPLSHCLSCYRLDDISQRQQPDLTTYVLNSNAGHAFTESFASPSGQGYARMTVFDGTLQDPNEKTGSLSQTVCPVSATSITTNILQCLICLPIWRVTSKHGQFTLQLTACSDQGWHIYALYLCPANCLCYVNHVGICDIVCIVFRSKQWPLSNPYWLLA